MYFKDFNFEPEKYLNLLFELCRTPGQSLNEDKRRAVIESFLKKCGIPSVTDMAGNLVVSFGRGEWANSVVYDAHIDVVGEGFSEPFLTDDGKIHGAGTGDNLTSAALLCLLAEKLYFCQKDLKRPVHILFSVGEEGYGNLKGVRQFVSDRKTPPFIFAAFDLSYHEYSVSGLGSKRYSVKIKGPGGHSWDNRSTPSAIESMIKFLGHLKTHIKNLGEKHQEPFSFNIGTISGGEGINIISEKAEAHFEFRSTSATFLEEASAFVISETENADSSSENIFFECCLKGERPASYPVKPEICEIMIKKIWGELSLPLTKTVRSTNINLPLSAGWPSLCTGLCECAGYHTKNEYVILSSVEKGWTLLKRITCELAFK